MIDIFCAYGFRYLTIIANQFKKELFEFTLKMLFDGNYKHDQYFLVVGIHSVIAYI